MPVTEITDLESIDSYKKTFREDVNKIKAAPVKFQLHAAFPFGSQKLPLVLFFAIKADLDQEITKKAKRTCKGTCKLNEQDQLEFEADTGELSYPLLEKAFKTFLSPKPLHIPTEKSTESESLARSSPGGYSRELNLAAQQKGGVRAEVLKGTETLLPNQVLDTIMQNFKKIGFKYESTNRKGTAVLDGAKAGDCRTLADAFVAVAQEIGFTDARTDGVVKDFMTGPGPIVDPSWGTGNANRGKNWLFQNHYWVVNGSDIYDILFTRHNLDLGKPREGKPVDDPETGLTYEVYGGVRYYAGMINSTYERFVTLSESELEKIKTEHRLKTQARKTDEEPAAEQSVEESIQDSLHFLEMRKELKTASAKLLLKMFQASGKKADELDDWIEGQTKQFMVGPNPLSMKCDEEKWKVWATSNK